jgi:hypothetical protein
MPTTTFKLADRICDKLDTIIPYMVNGDVCSIRIKSTKDILDDLRVIEDSFNERSYMYHHSVDRAEGDWEAHTYIWEISYRDDPEMTFCIAEGEEVDADVTVEDND